MTIFINPGSGPVAEATCDNAIDNIFEFINDLYLAGHAADLFDDEVPPEDQGDGRWRFHLVVDETHREVDMPGLPLAAVRFLEAAGLNPWDFPRLYVDGSSWLWCFALAACEPDEEEEDA